MNDGDVAMSVFDQASFCKRSSDESPTIFAYIIIFTYTVRTLKSALHTFKAQLLQALAHPTRIVIVEALRAGEVSAGTLLTRLNIEQANLSQHLAVLRAKHVVVTRKSGNQVYYALRDPALVDVLDLLRRYFLTHLGDTVTMLGEIDEDTTTDEDIDPSHSVTKMATEDIPGGRPV